MNAQRLSKAITYLVMLSIALTSCTSASTVIPTPSQTQEITTTLTSTLASFNPQDEWEVIGIIADENKPIEKTNTTNNWVEITLTENIKFSNGLQVKINMESKGVNGLLFESNRPGDSAKRLEIFYENQILNVHLRDGAHQDVAYTQRVSLPLSTADVTTGEVILIFDKNGEHVKIYQGDNLVMEISVSEVASFPQGLFPNGNILRVVQSSGANSSVRLTELEFLVPKLDSGFASIFIPTLTPAATSTIALPVGIMTAVPSSNTQIKIENVKNLEEIANYSGNWEFYLRQHNFQFIDMNTLAFESALPYSNGPTKPCNIQINNGLSMCTDQNIILGTDGQYYSYSVINGNLEIRSNVDLNKFYSIALTGSQRVTLEGIDTVNKIIFYEAGIYEDHKTIIQDIENQHIIARWQGSTYISSIKFDKNKKLAAICRKKGNAWSWNFVDSLLLLDLTQKTIIYDVPFDCWGDYSFSNDGKKLVTEHFSINPNNSSVTISVTDIFPPYQRNKFEMENSGGYGYAITFSPDDKMIITNCQSDAVCFLDATDGKILFQMKTNPGINGLDFSPNGTLLAASISGSNSINLWAVPPFNFDQSLTDSEYSVGFPPPTPIPAFAPTLSSELAMPLDKIFPGIEVVKTDTFDDPKGPEWNLDSSVTEIKIGILKINGIDWKGITRNSEFREGSGVFTNFMFTQDAYFTINFNSGIWATDFERQYGILLNSSNSRVITWKGNDLTQTPLSGNVNLEANKWYSILMTIGKNGEFYIRIWDPVDPQNFMENSQILGSSWSGLSWTFGAGGTKGILWFDDFKEVTTKNK